ELEDNSVDSIVTDPPYGLSFMGKRWDYDVPSVDIWKECLRVLKPGGHLLCFAGTRTQHRMAVRIEDAGFEIRDMIAWVYGSGFPKSLDVSKAIDKAAGAERTEVVGETRKSAQSESTGRYGAWGDGITPTIAATPEAKQWEGWGTALKPALEPITVARKPLIGTVAENVLQHGTGAINVDGCRVDFISEEDRKESTQKNQHADFGTPPLTGNNVYGDYSMIEPKNYNPTGRWPANFIHDGSEEATDLLGSAARFFYCPKASKRDRDEGCEGMGGRYVCGSYGNGLGNVPKINGGRPNPQRNNHPTVKPTDLMRYLCRLVTPPSGIVLDPFMGSGSTGKGAILEGFDFIGIEREEEYCKIAERRIEAVVNNFW
ncbi:MAG: site-specific DNA-methyltransferase, partial [Flavobacteriia bacterium]|nr:site-specific DNA-methyltransferase [Flavobacteriia bacterium]